MEKIFTYRNGKLKASEFVEAFPFLKEKGHIISLVGAGGKTTLMMSLAELCSNMGMKVLVSTTTHIVKPGDGTYVNTMTDAYDRWNSGQVVVVGSELNPELEAEVSADFHVEENKIKSDDDKSVCWKLAMLPEEILDEYMRQADIVFLEADGSKRKPLKVPNSTEPVIIDKSDIVIALCGLSSLGQTFGTSCFRLKETENLLHKSPEDIITEEDISRIMTSGQGAKKTVENRKYYIVLNQCDNEAEKNSACSIGKLIHDAGEENIIVTCLMNNNEN
jgi:probable selenium-dependent hydroxylase accessory protein YqeC